MISCIIPTYNNLKLWENYKLLNSLCNQTETDAEVLIVDDKSEDGTLEFLKNYIQRNDPPFHFRLIKCIAEKKNYTQSSCIPDNIGFKEAKGDIIVHLDSDGWVHINLLKHIKSLDLLNNISCYFGQIIFVKPDTFEPFSYDSRLGRPLIEARKINPNKKTVRLKPEYKACWGSLYCTTTQTIKEIGGHVMKFSHKRGVDARIGTSLLNKVPCYFTIEEQMTFWHIGNSWIRRKAAEGKSGLEEIAKEHKIPFQSYFVKENEIISNPTIVNGGLAFWTSGILDNLYEEIEI